MGLAGLIGLARPAKVLGGLCNGTTTVHYCVRLQVGGLLVHSMFASP